MAKRGLGRRLEELLAGSNKTVGIDSLAVTKHAPDNNSSLRLLPLDKIQAGRYQPRTVFQEEALQELADSIKSQGVIQPVVIRPIGDKYELIAGERRWRAAQLAGLHDIPAIVQEISDEAAIAMGLIENIQREDLNAIEEAQALQRLIDEFEMSHVEVAEAVGRSRASVSNLLRLLKLNREVKTLLEHGDLDAGHAKVLLALEGHQQSDAARLVVDKNLSVRETEQLVRQTLHPTQKTPQQIDPNVRSLQNNLSDTLGAKVQIQQNAKGKGKLVIHYSNLDQLDGILSRLRAGES